MMEKNKKCNKENRLRLKSDINGNSNIINRVSLNFKKKLDNINMKRKENGFDSLSFPKQTELIIKHKKYWKLIEEDMIHYNTTLETSEDTYDEK